jgi:hypothetical protein
MNYEDQVPWTNGDTEDAPPYCLLMSTGEIDPATGCLTFTRPDTDSLNGLLVNGSVSVAPGKAGTATVRVHERIAYDGPDEPEPYDSLGSVANGWFARAGKAGFTVLSAGRGVADVVRTPLPTPPGGTGEPGGRTYNCVSGRCVDPGDGTGFYATLAGCQQECQQKPLTCGDPPAPPPPPPPPPAPTGYDCLPMNQAGGVFPAGARPSLFGMWGCFPATENPANLPPPPPPPGTGGSGGGSVHTGGALIVSNGQYATRPDCTAAGCYNARIRGTLECDVAPCSVKITPDWYDPSGLGDTFPPYTGTIDWGDGSGTTSFSGSAPADWGSLSHTYATDGAYTVTIVMVDSNGKTVQTTRTATVYCGTPPTVPPAPTPFACRGIVTAVDGCGVAFDVQTAGGTGAVTATVDDWGDGASSAPGTHTYAAAGRYTVNYSAHDSGTPQQTCSGSVPVDVTACANPFAVSAFATNLGGCNCQLFLSPANSAGGTVTYLIDWGDGVTETTTFPGGNHQYGTGGGPYRVTVTATSPGPPVQTASTTITAPVDPGC